MKIKYKGQAKNAGAAATFYTSETYRNIKKYPKIELKET